MILCPEDEKLIKLIRSIKFGEIKVTLKRGRPVMVERAIKIIKLDEVQNERNEQTKREKGIYSRGESCCFQ